MTPPAPLSSAYPEVFYDDHAAVYSDSKNLSAKTLSGLYRGEGLNLPPLSSVVPDQMAMEPTSPNSNHRPSSSSYSGRHLEHYPFSHRLAKPVMPEATIHRSIEHSDDGAYSDQPLGSPSDRADLSNQHQLSHDDAEESHSTSSSSKKVSKAVKDGTTQKRYPCKHPTCGKSYTTSGHASRHAKVHEGEKNIACSHPGCPKRFTRSDNMKQHLETHRKERTRNSNKAGGAASRRRERPTLAQRRQSMASSRGSASRFSTPRESPPLMSPGFPSVSFMSPGLSPAAALSMSPRLSSDGFARPNIASRTPSGLDTLAMAAAAKSASGQQEQNHVPESPIQEPEQQDTRPSYQQYWPQHTTLSRRF
ncbi:unnamed protein product [Discula destructiva]